MSTDSADCSTPSQEVKQELVEFSTADLNVLSGVIASFYLQHHSNNPTVAEQAYEIGAKIRKMITQQEQKKTNVLS